MYPNEQIGKMIVEMVSKMREHFDVVYISGSLYDDEDGQTYQYVNHRGHIKAVIGDMQEHLDMLRDADAGGPPAHEHEHINEEADDQD